LDGLKVHLGQWRDRQERKCHDSHHSQRRHDQRGRDRPANEGFREVHGVVPAAGDVAPGALAATAVDVIVTRALASSLYCPSVTPRSPSVRPVLITVRSPDAGPSSIRRGSATFSPLTIQANRPWAPR